MSDRYGNRLLELMSTYNKNCLADITEQEAKEFYEYLLKQRGSKK